LDYMPPYPPAEEWCFLQDPDAALELFRAADGCAVASIARACEVSPPKPHSRACCPHNNNNNNNKFGGGRGDLRGPPPRPGRE